VNLPLQQSTYKAHHGSYEAKKESKKEPDTGDTKKSNHETLVSYTGD
jgi:hypothetical protein